MSLTALAAAAPVRTAADVAAAVPVVPEYVRPDTLGDMDGDLVMVDAAALGAVLRERCPSGARLDYRDGWWRLACPLVGLDVTADTCDELAGRAVTQLRHRVADVDPTGTLVDVVVWTVRLSDDDQLREWLTIPA